MSRHTLGLDDTLHSYLLAHGTREPAVAAALRERTATHAMARMQISPEQGQFMDFLVRALGVRRAIEVGTFTGYSALRVALALPEDGELLCCDVSDEYTTIGKPFWARAGVDHKITLVIAPASQTLQARIDAGEAGTWDFAFVDADKSGYATYIDQLHTLLRPGGVIGVDNVLWGGKVLDADDDSVSTTAIRALNAALAVDPRWDLVMLPIGDGLTLLRRR